MKQSIFMRNAYCYLTPDIFFSIFNRYEKVLLDFLRLALYCAE
jgi:hypothetical protein